MGHQRAWIEPLWRQGLVGAGTNLQLALALLHGCLLLGQDAELEAFF